MFCPARKSTSMRLALAPAACAWRTVPGTRPIDLGTVARRRDRFRSGWHRRKARGKRAVLRSQGWPVRLELLSREPPRLPADPHRGDRAGSRLWRRRGRHVPPATPGSGRRRLGAARHIGRRRVRDAERHVGCIRRRCQPVARWAPAHASRCRRRDSSISISSDSGARQLRSTRACATRCSSPGRSRRRTGNSHPSPRGPSACATSTPTWTPSHATPPFRASPTGFG